MKKNLLATTLALLSLSAQAQSDKPLFCVWDILGKSGDIYNLMVDQSLHMAKTGMSFEIKRSGVIAVGHANVFGLREIHGRVDDDGLAVEYKLVSVNAEFGAFPRLPLD